MLLFSFSALEAQEYLLVRKKGSTRRYEYRVGDTFVYRQQGMDQFFKDVITDFVDSTIVLENNIVLISQLEEIDIQNAFTNRPQILRQGEALLPTIGYGLLALDLFNHTIIDGNDFSFDKGTTITSGAFVAAGYGLKIFRRKRVDLTKEKFEAYLVLR